MSSKTSVVSAVQIDPFIKWAHGFGRAGLIVFIVLMVAIPFIVCAAFDCMPTIAQILPGAISILALMGPLAIAEVGSYTPILGSSSYLTFATGNIMNLKLPCVMNAQQLAKVEPNTTEGDAIALIATTVSSIVTIVVLALGLLLVVPLKPFLQSQAVSTASNYLLPSLLGCMLLGFLGKGSGETYVRNKLLIAVVPAVLIAVLTILRVVTTSYAGILIVVMIPVCIGCARILYKKGVVSVVANPASAKKAGAAG